MCKLPSYKLHHGNKQWPLSYRLTGQPHIQWRMFHLLNWCLVARWEPNLLLCNCQTANSDAEVRQRVSNRQIQIKTYCDKKRGPQASALKVGDKVSVKKQTHVPKGHPRFTKPVEIQKQWVPAHTDFLMGNFGIPLTSQPWYLQSRRLEHLNSACLREPCMTEFILPEIVNLRTS